MSSRFNSFRIGQDDKPSNPSTNPWLKKVEGYSFETQQDVADAMSNPLYETNSEFRAGVAVVLSRSNVTGGPIVGERGALERGLANRKAARKAEEAEIHQEAVLALFNTDLYRTSPTERRRVRDLIAANSAAVDATMGHRVVDRSLTPGVRVQITEEEMQQIRSGVKQEAKEKRVAEAKQAALNAYHEAMNTANHEDDDDGSNEGTDAPAAE
jgi:hypothetical protein